MNVYVCMYVHINIYYVVVAWETVNHQESLTKQQLSLVNNIRKLGQLQILHGKIAARRGIKRNAYIEKLVKICTYQEVIHEGCSKYIYIKTM